MSTIAVDNVQPSAGGTSFTLEGVAKALLDYDQTTPVVNNSANVSSVTDNAGGDASPNFTNNFGAADYYIQQTMKGQDNATIGSANNPRPNAVSLRATGTFRSFAASLSAVLSDAEINFFAVFGDLA